MSVRVAVRSRPMNEAEEKSAATITVSMHGNSVNVHEANDGDHNNSEASFVYDHAFWSSGKGMDDASQELIYNLVGAALIEHVLTGYNGCIFAYGQTGSGKTYSMMGTPHDPGLIPRITEELFARTRVSVEASEDALETCVEVSYYEIYKERVRCLLRPTAGGFSDTTLRVREHPKYGPFVEGLSKFVVTEQSDFLKLMEDGNRVRMTASTSMNVTSSRSHAVFTIVVTQKQRRGPVVTTKTSRLNLVDLAGSERVSKTHATGERLSEGANINRSLMCLGNVISALAETEETEKKRHIPYRDSTLTWILKDNLGGNSKTVMLATISPCSAQYEETMSTLRYAERAKKIVNKAVVNESKNNEVVAALQREITELKAQLRGASTAERARLQEELDASEAMKKSLGTSLKDKLEETKALMREREDSMRQLEQRLQAQTGEIDALRDSNAEKEKQIMELLRCIKTMQAGSSAAVAEVEDMRGQVAALEQEQQYVESQFLRSTIKTPFSCQYDEDLCTVEGDSLDGRGIQGPSWLVETHQTAHDGVTSETELEYDDIEFDESLASSILSGSDQQDLYEGAAVSYNVGSNRADGQRDSLSQLSVDEDLILDEDINSTIVHDPNAQSISISSLNGSVVTVGCDSASGSGEHTQSPLAVLAATHQRQLVPPIAIPSAALQRQGHTAARATAALTPNIIANLLRKGPRESADIASPSRDITTLTVPSHTLPNNRYLQMAFKVQVLSGSTSGSNCGSEDVQTWIVDIVGMRFVRAAASGHAITELLGSDLYCIGTDCCNRRRVFLHFLDLRDPYVLTLSSPSRRQRFYELAMALRRDAVLWCPHLCPGSEAEAVIEVRGTTIEKLQGSERATVPIEGTSRFRVARVPYEVIDVWYGCFSLANKSLPQSPAVFSSFIPSDAHEVYIVGVTDVPLSLMGCGTIGEYLLACVGSADYFVLANTSATEIPLHCKPPADSPATAPAALLVICRRSFIVRFSSIETGFVPPTKKDVDGSTSTTHYGATACSLRINEASFGIVLINPTFANAVGKRDVYACKEELQALLSSVPIGDPSLDIRVRFDYLLVAGALGSDGANFTEQDPARFMLSGMCEAAPSVALRYSLDPPMRLFYAARRKVARITARQYNTSRALANRNASLSADVFCRRPYLSAFNSCYSRHVRLVFGYLRARGDRLLRVQDTQLSVAGSFLADSTHSTVAMTCTSGNEYETTSNATAAIAVNPFVSSDEFLRPQVLELSLRASANTSGRVASSPPALGTGVLPLKGVTQLAEWHPFEVDLFLNSTVVGQLTGAVMAVHTAHQKHTVDTREPLSVTVWCFENDCRGVSSSEWMAADIVTSGEVLNFSSLDLLQEQTREGFELPSECWKWVSEWRYETLVDGSPCWYYSDCRDGGPYQRTESRHSALRRLRWMRAMATTEPLTYHSYYTSKFSDHGADNDSVHADRK